MKQVKVFLNGCYGACNLGDDIMLKITINDLEKITNKRLHINVKNKGNKQCLISQSYISNLFNINKLKEFAIIAKSDLYIWGGGTFLYESKDNGIKSLLSILVHVLIAKLFNVKVIFYGIGYGELRTFVGKNIASVIVKLSDFVTVRDKESYLDIKSIKNNIYLTNDLVYRLDIDSIRDIDVNKKKNLNIILNTVYYQTPKEIDKFAGLIEEKIKLLKIDIEIVNFHLIPAWHNEKTSDTDTNKKLIDSLMNKWGEVNYTIHENKNVDEILLLISESDIVFAQRLHILLISVLLEKQIFTLSYHTKIDKFLNDINYNQYGFYDKFIINKNKELANKNFILLQKFLDNYK